MQTGPWNPLLKQKQHRLNTRFFLALNIALVLISLATLLIPCVQALREAQVRSEKWGGVLATLSVTFFLLLGLLYAVRKGYLDWISDAKKVLRERERND